MDLSYNTLTSLPDSLGYMSSLEILNLNGSKYNYYSPYDNEITNFPSSIGLLSNLKELYLQHNKIDSIPDALNNLSNLEKLQLNNQSSYDNGNYISTLSYFPVDLNGLTSLEEFSFQYSDYQGEIDISELNQLQYFNAYKNKLTRLYLPAQDSLSYYGWNVTENPYLSCLDVDSISLPLWNNETYSIVKDNGVIFSEDCSGNSVPHAERLALIDLYKESMSPYYSWSNWDTNEFSLSNVGAWQGVTTDTINGQKHVVELDLNGLNYTIPTSFQNFTQLKECKLNGYSNAGNYFESLGDGFILPSLEKLTVQSITENTLPNSIGTLTNLKEFTYSQYSGNGDTTTFVLPDSFGDLESLEKLKITNTRLKTLPESFGDLNNLKTINIKHNKLSTLPESIGRLDSVIIMDLSYNTLTSLPDSLGYMSSLEILNLNGSKYNYYSPYDNEITNFPSSIGLLSNLKELYLQDNEIPGEIDLSNCLLLEKLKLNNNYINHLKLGVSPSSFGSTSLGDFNISSNRISCVEVPTDELISWRLYDHYNKYDDGVGFSDNCTGFSHEVPDQERLALIDFYKEGNGKVWSLNAYENHYDTNIYSLENVGVWYGVDVEMLSDSLEHVVELKVHNKGFKGEILTNIDSLTYLRKLEIYHDTLNNIPSDLNNLAYLDEINFNYSQIGDTLNFTGLNSINKLNLANNQINGLVLTQDPDSFASDYDLRIGSNPDLYCVKVPSQYLADYQSRNWSNLGSQTEFSTDCTGKFTVPTTEKNALIEIYNATNGDQWTNNTRWLQNNNVSSWYGVTVELVGGEKHVTKLSLYNNNLNGFIPDAIADLPYLKEINFGYNNLSGGISSNTSTLDSLENINVRNCQIPGVLDLSNNPNLSQVTATTNSFNIVRLGMPRTNFSSYYYLNLSNNPLLSCIEVQPSEVVAYDTFNWYSYVPSTAQFLVNCQGPIAVVKADTVFLDFSGQASISASDLDNGSMYADSSFGPLTFTLSDSMFNCSEVGINNLLFTATDTSGLFSVDSTHVLVVDSLSPLIYWTDTVFNITSGHTNFVLSETNILNEIYDNCAIDTAYFSQNTFNCGEPAVMVAVTAIDENGNMSTDSISVAASAGNNPEISANNVTMYLNETGNLDIDTSDLDFTISQTCEILTPTISQTQFDCSDIGNNSIHLNIINSLGQEDSTTFVLEILDTIAPTIELYSSITEYLNEDGILPFHQSWVDSASSDNCNFELLSLIDTLHCGQLGPLNATFHAQDASGNLSTTQDIVIHVLDTFAPVLILKDTLDVYIPSTGQASISFSDFDLGSYDNCGIITKSNTNGSAFCSHLGFVTATIGAGDLSDNFSYQDIVYHVQDTLAPIGNLVDTVQVYLDATGVGNLTFSNIDLGSTDNCGIDSTSLSLSTFNCSHLYDDQMVDVIIYDASMNMFSSEIVVQVMDTLAPELTTVSSVNVYLDQSGETHFDAGITTISVTDACDVAMYSNVDSFYCSDLGSQLVNVWAEDGSGNASSIQNVTVHVIDSLSPSVNVKDTFQLYLNLSGSAEVVFTDLDLGSADNCGIDSTAISNSNFNCSNIGYETVQVHVFDALGNVSQESVVIEVLDSISPEMTLLSGQEVFLDANGEGILSENQLIDFVSDNCGFTEIEFDSLFQCPDLGAQMVTVVATDDNGNVTTDSVQVIIQDTISPNLEIMSSINVYLDSIGEAYLDAMDVDSGTIDNCTYNLFSSLDSFFCTDLGVQMVDVWAEDEAGNSSATQAINVHVLDTIAPIIVSIPDTVTLTCAVDMFQGFDVEDNCGVDTMYIDPASVPIYMGDTGYFEQNIIITDASGNQTEKMVIYHIIGFDMTVTYQSNELSVAESGLSYQWFTCPDTTFISGATNQNYTPMANGEYGVMVSDGNCEYYSTCFQVNGIGIDEYASTLEVLPNPMTTHFEVVNLTTCSTFELISMYGKTVQKGEVCPGESISVNALIDGTYLLKINEYKMVKLIKE
ncbi:MAG: leucine-rich repeat domain-containing protein [Flavobacteriales bacterium]